MNELGPEPGIGSAEAEECYRSLRTLLSRGAFGQDEPRGRGRTLKDVVWTEGKRGPSPALPHPRQTVHRAGEWITHLVNEGIWSEEEWISHIGGLEDELGVDYPPDLEPLRRAFRALDPRFKALREAESRVELRRERLGSAKRNGIDLREAEEAVQAASAAVQKAKGALVTKAVYEAVAAARFVRADAVRKAVENQGDGADECRDQPGVWGLDPRPGALQVYVDTENFHELYPEGWWRL